MSVLVIQIEPRQRAAAAAAPALPGHDKAASDFSWVFSADNLNVSRQGRCAPALLPRADTVVAVLSDVDVGWHTVTVPKAPAARLRAALGGLLEEAVLDDVDSLHFALAPELTPGQTGWVAALQHQWLAATLGELERAGIPVDRVVPSTAPAEPAEGHFLPDLAEASAPPRLVFSHKGGVSCLSLSGGLAKALVAQSGTDEVRWTAHPAAVAAAERWLGTPVSVLDDAQRALGSTRTAWNLRQFDLLPRHRGTLALRDLWRRFFSPAWKPVRWGLTALVALQLVGVNVWAWQQERGLAERRKAMNTLLQGTHPQVRAVLDAPLQMQRETETLRGSAGKPGDNDLEPLMAAAAAAWPDGRAPVQNLRFEPGKLVLMAPGWTPEQLAQFQQRLRPAGLLATLAEGRITLTRASNSGSAG